MEQTYRLSSLSQAHAAVTGAWQLAKTGILAGHRFILILKPETRSSEQNAKLHAALSDIAKQVGWAGRKWDVTVWKRLCTAAWLRARGEAVQIIPAIDGNGVDIVFEHTSQLSKPLMSELIEFVLAWGTEHGVEWSQ